MKKMSMLAILMATMFLSGAAWAGEDGQKMDEWADFRTMMTERHKMVRGMMEMNRELMVIIKNLNHKLSGEDKEKLGNMIKDIDTMIAHDVEIGKKMMKKWNKKDWGDKGHHGNM